MLKRVPKRMPKRMLKLVIVSSTAVLLAAAVRVAHLGVAPLPVTMPPEAGGCGGIPATMRAARVHTDGDSSVLRVDRVAVPSLRRNTVLVRVHAASVNPVDWKLQDEGSLGPLAIPGGDFAGEVVAVAPGVSAFRCGDAVAGTVDQVAGSGSYAEYLVAPLDAIVRKPERFSMQEAAAYPTVAIAAWRFLIAGADVRRGERVLVQGAAGGVGSMVVQLARARGATVIGTASARNHAFLRELGVDQVIDYTTTRFEEAVRDVDVVMDAVGGETLARSVAVVRRGGRLVTSAGSVPVKACRMAGIVCPPRAPWDVQRGLTYVAPLIEAGALRVHVDSVYVLDEVMAAQRHSRSGRTRGKVVIDMQVGEIAGVPELQAYLSRRHSAPAGR